ncbi:MAG: lamin tail domain-containing protein, partial [Halothiobacillus sp.]
IFDATVSGTGASTQFTPINNRGDIKTQLVNWDKNNGHGLGANYFGFAASVNGVIPENVNGFSVEGMTSSPDGKYLWLAFRAPQTDTTTRSKALIVSVQLSDLFSAAPITTTDTNTTLTFGPPIELDLGGRGIRSINKVADGTGYLIVAGPAGSASTEVTNDFRLYTWSGLASSTPTELDNSLDTLLATTKGSFESSVSPASTKPGTCVELIQDDGDTVWPGQTGASKDLDPALQQFQGNRVQLGMAFKQTTPPMLASSLPANNANNASPIAPIILSFDRGVLAGTGAFELKKASDDSTVATFTAGTTAVSIAYNKVTLAPSAALAADTAYYLTAASGALVDHSNNVWAGLSGTSVIAFKTAAPVHYDLAITEVNSNATGGDFFELYNYGAAAIDISGWKWDDSAAKFNDASAATFTAGTVIAPNERLVVVQATTDTAFRTAWNNLSTSIKTAAVGGPGLGKGDAVVVFDTNGQVAAAMNYGATALAASDGSAIAPA